MAKIGRPTIYTTEFIEKEAVALLQYAEESPLPFLEKFTVDRGYHPQRITEPAWENNYLFSEALKKAKALLKYKLVVGTLAGKLNPAMAIFALKNVAGWRDVTALEHSGEVKGAENKVIVIYANKNTEANTNPESRISAA